MPKIIAKVSKSDLSVKYYDDLLDKPTINGVEVSGDKTASDYGLVDENTFAEALERVVDYVTITEF